MGRWQYTKGLHDLGNHVYAYLQPDGGWGWSNAGLIAHDAGALLVDTLFDLSHTREMLDTMRARVPGAQRIDTLINTHANPDHTFGNELVPGAEIIGTSACAQEMRELQPDALAMLMRNASGMGTTGAFLRELFGVFNFEGITLTPPTRTFDGDLSLMCGGREIRLVEVGPAHTRGDLVVYVPDDRTVFTGDILFANGHPVIWAGPIANWISACDRILAWAPETVVPGHGPITDCAAIARLKTYLTYIVEESRARFEAGMSIQDAARDIALDDYEDWGEAERMIANVAALYREFGDPTVPSDIVSLLGMMAAYRQTTAG
jgi:glyoxylase-like metal-dependent hydrolase (beta-lactamase superfamily II)